MPKINIAVFTVLAMLAFAGNSLLCRLALKTTSIDAATFTSVRLISAAFTLWLLLRFRDQTNTGASSWPSALALFAYAAGFSFAYINLTAATGALLLFGSVQLSMISYGLWHSERMSGLQIVGLACAFGGLIALVFPGLASPPLLNSIMMIAAGCAWGIYSLRGRGAGDPLMTTAGNFLRTVPVTLGLSLLWFSHAIIDGRGVLYAIASGAITSGIGYAVWYKVLPFLKATHAATIQLSVPVIAAAGGMILLGEPLTWRFIFSSIAILSGIALVIFEKNKA
jgi:drug/metabolite transporter (DMT)-like permease